ncbi:MAG: serine hydrolase domain-containing protein [Alphaproteobacteria bacterium]
MEKLEQAVPGGRVAGQYDARFKTVADRFAANFSELDELGASVCVTLNGETVVDLWGGRVVPDAPTAWNADTVSIIFSSTKGATALCAHILADRGLLDLDAPVAKYWPEFARHGKEKATVRMMLDHSAGVPALREPLAKGAVNDWDLMCDRLANETPFWEPGTRHGYHALTFGWTVGELVRRVSGKSLGTFFRDEVAKPLGLDFWIGTPELIESRVSPIIQFKPEKGAPLSPLAELALADRNSIPGLFIFNDGGFNPNRRDCHAAEIPGANGITNARGLAVMYAPLANGGTARGVKLVSAESVARMGQVSMATHLDETLRVPTRFALGFMKSMDNRARGNFGNCVLSERAFGHVGAGGSIGFADPSCGLSFGYTMNRMGDGILLNDRGQGLVDAAYRVLGFTSNAGGVWI